MFCPKCDGDGKWIMMDAMGYGDEQCPECGHNEYTDMTIDVDEDEDDEGEKESVDS